MHGLAGILLGYKEFELKSPRRFGLFVVQLSTPDTEGATDSNAAGSGARSDNVFE